MHYHDLDDTIWRADVPDDFGYDDGAPYDADKILKEYRADKSQEEKKDEGSNKDGSSGKFVLR